jgi:NTE family protein
MSDDSDAATTNAVAPVHVEDEVEEERNLTDDVALCLSGGGYRAMLFHVGAIIRLNELGKLPSLGRVSSVSGGSITAGLLGLRWRELDFDANDVARNLHQLIVDPIVEMAGKTIDKPSILWGIALPFRTIGQQVAAAYDQHLFHGATLQDLPAERQGPRFVINATNVQTGRLFRFSRPYQGDYSVGLWRDPTTRLADAVTASSAFPPVLSPHTVKPSGTFDGSTVGKNSDMAFRKKLWLSDGGVYDNLGLETAWKRCRTLLVSDGGGALGAETSPKRNWAQHGIRVSEIVDGQVRALRKRQLIGGFRAGVRDGTYWGVRAHARDYPLDDPFDIPEAQRGAAAVVKTRLAALDEPTKQALVNWGYTIADAALRSFVFRDALRPNALPFPRHA